jgi:hypothetical protein
LNVAAVVEAVEVQGHQAVAMSQPAEAVVALIPRPSLTLLRDNPLQFSSGVVERRDPTTAATARTVASVQ